MLLLLTYSKRERERVEKAHDINFPPNFRHRRHWKCVWVCVKARERKEGQKMPRKPKAFSQTTNTWKYFCMMEWKRGYKKIEREREIGVVVGRRRWGVTLCFRSSCLCVVCICVSSLVAQEGKAKFECEEFVLSLSPHHPHPHSRSLSLYIILLRYITL